MGAMDKIFNAFGLIDKFKGFIDKPIFEGSGYTYDRDAISDFAKTIPQQEMELESKSSGGRGFVSPEGVPVRLGDWGIGTNYKQGMSTPHQFSPNPFTRESKGDIISSVEMDENTWQDILHNKGLMDIMRSMTPGEDFQYESSTMYNPGTNQILSEELSDYNPPTIVTDRQMQDKMGGGMYGWLFGNKLPDPSMGGYHTKKGPYKHGKKVGAIVDGVFNPNIEQFTATDYGQSRMREEFTSPFGVLDKHRREKLLKGMIHEYYHTEEPSGHSYLKELKEKHGYNYSKFMKEGLKGVKESFDTEEGYESWLEKTIPLSKADIRDRTYRASGWLSPIVLGLLTRSRGKKGSKLFSDVFGKP